MTVTTHGVPSPTLIHWLFEDVTVGSWADLGCGPGTFTSSLGITAKKGVGVDMLESAPHLPPSFTFERASIDDWISRQGKKSFDLVSMFDLVEHIPKKDAVTLIERAKEVGRSVLVSTPSGFLKQDAETHPEEATNPYQWHRSGFTPGEFEKLGFLVFVLKNYHYKPAGNNRTFDKLVCFAGERDNKKLARRIRKKAFFYNLSPIHLYRTVRDVFLRPLF